MRHYEDLRFSGDSFEVRDRPSALCSALGRVALERAELERRVVAKIHLLEDAAGSAPAPLDDYSLRKKLDVLRELITTAERDSLELSERRAVRRAP